jgi:hypothetical protein
MSLSLYIGEDLAIQMTGLKNAITDAYVNDATMTYTLKTAAGVAVTGASAISMPYVAASDGNYRGTMDSSVSGTLTNDTVYYLEISVSGSVFRRISCVAQYRGES